MPERNQKPHREPAAAAHFSSLLKAVENEWDGNVAVCAELRCAESQSAAVNIPTAVRRAKNADVVTPVAVEIARNGNVAVLPELLGVQRIVGIENIPAAV